MKLFALYGDLELATVNFNQGVEAARAQMSELQGQMGDLQTEAEKTSDILDSAFGHALGDILSGITQAAIETAFTFATEGVELAASMEEIHNVVDTTFGSASASRINAWAKTTKEAYGIGALSAKDYVSTMGATLKGMGIQNDQLYEMSTALVGLAGDMASFRNLGTEDTFRKIMSGMTGEMEPLKQLGIIMSATNLESHALAMGISEDWSKLDSATQTQVRFNYLMQQTADMQGDFAKTSESYSNQMRLMQENIEQLKLSVGESLLPVMNELVGWFNSLFGSQENAADGIEAIKDAYSDTYVSIETTTTNALALINALDELSASTEDAASTDTWNAIMQELASTLPGISSLINDNTGSIEGGTQALKDYVEQWRITSMNLARQKVVQDMYDEYASMEAEIYKLQTEQQVADIRRSGAKSAMADLANDVLGYMIEGMENMGASSADIEGMRAIGAKKALNFLSRIAIGGSANSVMGEIYEGGDIFANKSYMKYFTAGGGSVELINQMAELYSEYEKTAKDYDIDNSAQISTYESLLANQEQELAILEQIMSANEASRADEAKPSGEEAPKGEEAAISPQVTIVLNANIDGQEVAASITPTVTSEAMRALSWQIQTKAGG